MRRNLVEQLIDALTHCRDAVEEGEDIDMVRVRSALAAARAEVPERHCGGPGMCEVCDELAARPGD